MLSQTSCQILRGFTTNSLSRHGLCAIHILPVNNSFYHIPKSLDLLFNSTVHLSQDVFCKCQDAPSGEPCRKIVQIGYLLETISTNNAFITTMPLPCTKLCLVNRASLIIERQPTKEKLSWWNLNQTMCIAAGKIKEIVHSDFQIEQHAWFQIAVPTFKD